MTLNRASSHVQELSKEPESSPELQKKVSVTDKEHQGGMVGWCTMGSPFSPFFFAACSLLSKWIKTRFRNYTGSGTFKVDPVVGGVMTTQPSFMTNFWQEGANQIQIICRQYYDNI